MNGYGYIEDVENIFKCTKICLQVGDCHHASFDTKNNRCYLKNAKGPEGVVYDSDFQTAPQHCQSNSCVLQVSGFMISVRITCSHETKVGCVFPMVIWSELRMGQYKLFRDDDVPHFTFIRDSDSNAIYDSDE